MGIIRTDVHMWYYTCQFLKLNVKVRKKPCAYIVNTANRHRSTGHWVVYYFDSSGSGHFFCSGGFPPTYYGPEFDQFLKLNSSTTVTVNHFKLQSKRSKSCGYYCILYLYYRVHQCNLSEMINNHFKGKTKEENDVLVQELVLERVVW